MAEMKRYALGLAALLGLVACASLPPCPPGYVRVWGGIDGLIWSCQPRPTPPPPSPPPASPSPEVSPSASPPPTPKPDPSPTPDTKPSPVVSPTPPPTPPPSPVPCVTATPPGPRVEIREGRTWTGTGQLVVSPGAGQKYERFKDQDGNECSVPSEAIEWERRMGNWDCPAGYPGSQTTPHRSDISERYCVGNPNPSTRWCLDIRANKVNCQTGAVEDKKYLADLDGYTGKICLPELPRPSPIPCVSPTPGPPPPSPMPSPSGAPPLDANGNYPEPPSLRDCPWWFAGARKWVGIAGPGETNSFVKRACGAFDGCIRIATSATEKTNPPWCPGPRSGQGTCELWPGCQYKEFAEGGSPPHAYMRHPSWSGWQRMDQRSADGSCTDGTPQPRCVKTHNYQHVTEGPEQTGGTLLMTACMEGQEPVGDQGCGQVRSVEMVLPSRNKAKRQRRRVQ